MSIQEDSNPKAIVEQAVLAAYAADGYLTADGKKDGVKVRATMFELLSKRKVLNKNERKAKAITHGEMVKKVFPSLPDPDTFGDQPEPLLASDIWDQVDKDLWQHTATSPSSSLQKAVVSGMGNGYVLVRTLLGNDKVRASYITDSLALIEDDLATPAGLAQARAAARYAGVLEMLALRQPQHAKRFLHSHDARMKSVMVAGHDRLALAAEAATAEPDEAAEEDAE